MRSTEKAPLHAYREIASRPGTSSERIAKLMHKAFPVLREATLRRIRSRAGGGCLRHSDIFAESQLLLLRHDEMRWGISCLCEVVDGSVGGGVATTLDGLPMDRGVARPRFTKLGTLECMVGYVFVGSSGWWDVWYSEESMRVSPVATAGGSARR